MRGPSVGRVAVLLAGIVLATVALPGCGPSGGEGLPFEPAGPDAAPDPAAPGPFPVGVGTWVVRDAERIDASSGEARLLRTEVWYPAAASARGRPGRSYSLRAEASVAGLDAAAVGSLPEGAVIPSTAVPGADADLAHGPFPVVTLSHGSFSLRFQHASLAIHLASHGYVVVAADHPGSTLWDGMRTGFDATALIASSLDRPHEVSYLLDRLEAGDAAGEDGFPPPGLADTTRAAAAGHSLGGATAVAMPCVDPRFGAAVLLTPVVKIAPSFGLDYDAYPVPVLGLSGTQDHTVPWKEQYCEYRRLDAPSLTVVEIAGAGHVSFTDLCVLDWAALSAGGAPPGPLDPRQDGCSADFPDWRAVGAVTGRFAAAFLNAHLRGSTASLDGLEPGTEGGTFRVLASPAPDWPDGGCP